MTTTILSDELPVITTADVLKTYPKEVQASQQAPIRDAIVAAETEMFLSWQEFAEYAAAQSDILRAVDIYLRGLAEDRGYFQQPGESDETYRARTLSVPGLVTPNDIMNVVNVILAQYTTIPAAYLERINDCWFITDGSGVHHSFIESSPYYGDRFFRSDRDRNGGYALENREPGAMWVFGDPVGRYFVIRIPTLDSGLSQHSFLYDGTLTTAQAVNTTFVNDGTDPSGSESGGTVALFSYPSQLIPSDVYALIVSSINRIKGQSMRWMLYVDPTLTE